MILVTGATGLLGAHLLLQLAGRSQKLRALYRTENTLQKTRDLFTHYNKSHLFDTIEWAKADITDIPLLEAAFAGITHVYHCAAHVGFDPRDESMVRKVNIEGTANMVNCALAFGVQKFCHVSSIAALGDVPPGATTINEETEWNAEKSHSDYAISKYGAEMEVWRARQEGLDAVIVNPGLIFGYGFWQQGTGAMLQSVSKGQSFYTLGSCGVVAVEDVVQCMIQLMERTSSSGERYTIVAENIPYEEVLEAIADGMHKKRPHLYATRFLTSLAWRADWLYSRLVNRKRKLTRSMAASSHTTEKFDNSKVVQLLGFTFIPVKPYLTALAAEYVKANNLLKR